MTKQYLYRKIALFLGPKFFFISPELMSALWYGQNAGELPHLRHPRNFNELCMSINLKAYKDKKQHDLRVRCADKYEVRDYVKEKGFGHILNECYGVYDSFDEIDFDQLPSKFVIKMTSGSHMNYICTDKSKLNLDELRSIVAGWFQKMETFGLKTAEWHYVCMKPRLIVEKYLHMLGEKLSLVDYKWHCFNGQVYHIETISDRDAITDANNCDTYNMNWERTECVKPEFHPNRRLLPKPACFEEMKKAAEVLSEDFEYVRVDMYEVEGRLLFGELTFTPMGCYESDYQPEYLEDMADFYYRTRKNL